MDAERTSLAPFNDPAAWATLLSLGAYLAVGIVAGTLYFRALWWNARRFAAGERVATTIALMIGRFVVLGGVLLLASLEGAMPLLTTALGILIARAAVMRRVSR